MEGRVLLPSSGNLIRGENLLETMGVKAGNTPRAGDASNRLCHRSRYLASTTIPL